MSLQVVGSWWTTKQRRVPLTVVTQSTVDRIPQLYSQCKSWRGPVSVVLYQALVQPTPGALTAENEEIMKNALLHVGHALARSNHDLTHCHCKSTWNLPPWLPQHPLTHTDHAARHHTRSTLPSGQLLQCRPRASGCRLGIVSAAAGQRVMCVLCVISVAAGVWILRGGGA